MSRKVVVIGELMLVIFLTLAFYFSVDLFNPRQTHSPPEIVEVRVETPVVINKEVQIMSRYIKTRNSKIPIEMAVMIAESIVEAAEKFNLNPFLLNGMAERESTYNFSAVSSADAKGIMQVLYEDGVDIDDKKVFDIKYNIHKSAEILTSKLKKSNGNMKTALEKYSGNAKGYVSVVHENIGRYFLFHDKVSNEIDGLTMN